MKIENLVNFKHPPLIEVVIGIQFREIVGYDSRSVGMIYDCLKTDYPEYSEHPKILPSFEKFGIESGVIKSSFRFETPTGEVPRIWMSSPDGSLLVQFQSDRLILNWKKSYPKVDYPRFEELQKLFSKIGHMLQEVVTIEHVNQFEVSYVNIVEEQQLKEAGVTHDLWGLNGVIKGISIEEAGPDMTIEKTQFSSSYIVKGSDGAPKSRFTISANPAIDGSRNRAINLTLSEKGPILGSFDFDNLKDICEARNRIVNAFAAITTDRLHKHWEKH